MTIQYFNRKYIYIFFFHENRYLVSGYCGGESAFEITKEKAVFFFCPPKIRDQTPVYPKMVHSLYVFYVALISISTPTDKQMVNFKKVGRTNPSILASLKCLENATGHY